MSPLLPPINSSRTGIYVYMILHSIDATAKRPKKTALRFSLEEKAAYGGGEGESSSIHIYIAREESSSVHIYIYITKYIYTTKESSLESSSHSHDLHASLS